MTDRINKPEHRRFLEAHLAPAVAVLAVAVSTAMYLYFQHRSWFFADDFSFLLGRRIDWHDLMTPHNEHWSLVPVVIYRVLYGIFGMRTHLPYALPVLAAHVVVCFALWRLVRRAGGTPWAACGGVVLMGVCGAGAENLIWDFQIGFVGSVMFGLLAILAIPTTGLARRRVALCWASMILGLMCSGIGLPMLLALGVYGLFELGWKGAIRVVSVPVIVYLIWYASYGRAGLANDNAGFVAHLHSSNFFWTGLVYVWEAHTGIPSAGFLILVLLYAPILCRRVVDPLARLALAMGSGAVGLYALTAWSRVQFGVSQATASRYVYVATALMIPAVAWSLAALTRRLAGAVPQVPYAARVVAIGLVGLTLVNMLSVAHDLYAYRRDLSVTSETKILAGAKLVEMKAPLLNIRPDTTWSPDVTAARLASAQAQGKLPHMAISDRDLLTARAVMQVASLTSTRGLPAVGTVDLASSPVHLVSGKCTTESVVAGETLTFRSGAAGAQLLLRTAMSSLEVTVASGNASSAQVQLSLVPGQAQYIASTMAGGTISLTFTAADPSLQLCGG